VQQTGELSHVIVCEEPGGVLVQESRGGEHVEPLVPIEVQDVADAVQDFTADPAVTRFQPAQRAVVDLGQTGDVFLRQPSLVSEARQQGSERFAWSGGPVAVSSRHFCAPIREKIHRREKTSRANWRGFDASNR
jgi:hypothetical protein